MDFNKRMRRSIASQQRGRCTCRRCVAERDEVRFSNTVCPTCGTRHCPHLQDHENACDAQPAAQPADGAVPPSSAEAV